MKTIFNATIKSVILSAVLSTSAISMTLVSTIFVFSCVAMAHEKTFPTKQLNALANTEQHITFRESAMRPAPDALKEFEKKYDLVFSKGELAGSLFLGSNTDKKTTLVAVFLDGKTDKGDTEFGASVSIQGKIVKVKLFSSPETSDATNEEFLKSLENKSAGELQDMKKTLAKESSQYFVVTLSQKALGRVTSSFAKK